MCRCASIFKRKRDFAGKITQKINSHVTLAQALYCLCKKTIWHRSMHYHNGLWIGRARTKAVVAKRFLNYTRFVFKPLNIVGNHDDLDLACEWQNYSSERLEPHCGSYTVS